MPYIDFSKTEFYFNRSFKQVIKNLDKSDIIVYAKAIRIREFAPCKIKDRPFSVTEMPGMEYFGHINFDLEQEFNNHLISNNSYSNILVVRHINNSHTIYFNDIKDSVPSSEVNDMIDLLCESFNFSKQAENTSTSVSYTVYPARKGTSSKVQESKEDLMLVKRITKVEF